MTVFPAPPFCMLSHYYFERGAMAALGGSQEGALKGSEE